MRNQILKFICVSIMMGVFGLTSAQAAVKFSVFGAGTSSLEKNTAATTVQTYKGVFNYGGGAQFEFPLGRVVGLEIGGVYLPRKYSIADSTAATTLTSTLTYVQMPLQFRFWLGRYVTLGLGGYYAMAVGKVKTSLDGVATDYSYADYVTKTSDFGLIGSFGFNLPLGAKVALLAEGRYAMGMVDINNPVVAGNTRKWTDMQGIVGLRFGGMAK